MIQEGEFDGCLESGPGKWGRTPSRTWLLDQRLTHVPHVDSHVLDLVYMSRADVHAPDTGAYTGVHTY